MRQLIALALALPTLLLACTDFVISATDGTVVNGRSMEFAIPLASSIRFHPRGEGRFSHNPQDKISLTWTAKYAFLGVEAFALEYAIDGINEKGLSVGALWLPGTEYEKIPPGQEKKALSIEELCNWMLGNFATVAEVRNGLDNVIIWGEQVKQLGGIPPLHIAVHDASGKSLVLEFIKGKKHVHDNPIGVLTNAPSFEWHIANLGNYLNLRAMNTEPVRLEGTVLNPPGHGGGMLGIPGDWMPPSRFVRMAAFKGFAAKPATAQGTVNLALHLLNTVDIPFGVVGVEAAKGAEPFASTQWVVVKDLRNLVLYYRTYDDLNLRRIDLSQLMDSKTSTVIPITTGEMVATDVTAQLNG